MPLKHGLGPAKGNMRLNVLGTIALSLTILTVIAALGLRASSGELADAAGLDYQQPEQILTRRGNTGNDADPQWYNKDIHVIVGTPQELLDAKGKAVKKGRGLECRMEEPKDTKHTPQSEYTNVGTSPKFTDGDLAKWGWRTTSNKVIPIGLPYGAEFGLEEAFNDLKISNDASQWVEISTEHLTDTHHVSDPEKTEKETYKATYGKYDSSINLAQGVIVATNNHKPENKAEEAGLDISIFPKLKQWSDVFFLGWGEVIAKFGQGSFSNIEHVFRCNLNNEETHAFLRMVVGIKDFEGPGAVGVWPGKSYPIEEFQGKAALAYPNAAGSAWLLAQHKQFIGVKKVDRLNIFNCPSWGGGARWCLYLHIRNL